MGRDGERWGEMGRDGERWGEMGRDGERWGDLNGKLGYVLMVYIFLWWMGFINNKIIWVCPFEWGTYCHRYGQFESGTDSHGPGAHFGLIPIPTTRSGHQGNKKGKFLQRWGWFFEFLFQFGEVLQRHFLKPWVLVVTIVQSWQPILWIFSHQVTRWWDFRLWVAARQTMNLRLYEKPGGLVDLEQVLKDWWNMVWVGTFRPRTLLDVGAIGNRKESFFKHISTVGQVLMGNTGENPLNTRWLVCCRVSVTGPNQLTNPLSNRRSQVPWCNAKDPPLPRRQGVTWRRWRWVGSVMVCNMFSICFFGVVETINVKWLECLWNGGRCLPERSCSKREIWTEDMRRYKERILASSWIFRRW